MFPHRAFGKADPVYPVFGPDIGFAAFKVHAHPMAPAAHSRFRKNFIGFAVRDQKTAWPRHSVGGD